MVPQPSDEALMLAYRAGDGEAFEALYGRWRGRLFRYLLHQAGDRAVAEELYQDIWLKVIGARARYEDVARFSTWLFRIARHRLIDHWRTARRHASVSLAGDQDDDDPAADPGENAAASPDQIPDRWLERKDLAERLAAAISGLPAAQRETFLLVEEGELTLAEIATVTGTSRETAKSRLRYALARLRAELEGWR